MKEEAMNTNDNYQTRAWMADKRSTLRHQPVLFIQAGELSNKNPTPSTSESENESSHSNPPEEEQNVTVIEESNTLTAPITDESRSHSSTARLETLSNDDLFVIDDKPHPVSDISQFSVSETSRGIPDSTPVPKGSSKLTISSPVIPLPPVEFIPTEENIVFTPRNQRRQKNRPAPELTNWEVPATFKSMTDTSAPDWTKPKKKQNRRKGHKQYLHLAQDEENQFIEPVGVEMAPIANDALQDYLENIREQGELSEEEENYINKTLAVEVGSAMEELTLDDKPSLPLEKRHSDPGMAPPVSRFSSAKLASSSTVQTSEKPDHVANLIQASEKDLSGTEKDDPTLHRKKGKSAEEDNWYMEAPESGSEVESSEDVSDAFDEQGDLLDEQDDPVWNTESDELTSKRKGKQKAIDSDDEDDDSLEDEDIDVDDDDDDEDEDDDDSDLDDDNEIIANMVLDDYDLDNLDLSSFIPPNLTKKSRTRQPNVPALPSAKDDIVSHLQSLWKHDRESKKQRKAEREKARLIGLLGSKAKTKSKGKKGKQAARREELVRVDELEGNGLVVDMRKINDEMRTFWEDNDATE
jgi:hypothetical protein